jgi:hypothetical protein
MPWHNEDVNAIANTGFVSLLWVPGVDLGNGLEVPDEESRLLVNKKLHSSRAV